MKSERSGTLRRRISSGGKKEEDDDHMRMLYHMQHISGAFTLKTSAREILTLAAQGGALCGHEAIFIGVNEHFRKIRFFLDNFAKQS